MINMSGNPSCHRCGRQYTAPTCDCAKQPMTAKDVSAINMLADAFMRVPADRRSWALAEVRKNTTSHHALAVLDHIEGLSGLERMSATEVVAALSRSAEPYLWTFCSAEPYLWTFCSAALASDRTYQAKKERLREHKPVYDADTGRTSPGDEAPAARPFVGNPACHQYTAPTCPCMEDETCPVCGRVDIPAYMCWRVGHLPIKVLNGEEPMSPNEYQNECLRTANANPDTTTERDRLANWALGLAGEAGELADALKKHLFHGKPLDRDALLKECGDVAWYLAVLASELGFTLEEVFAKNVDKLRRRYPEGFSTEASLKRVDVPENGE